MKKNIFDGAQGREKKVEPHPTLPDHVIGKFHEAALSERYVRARFYLTKIMHLLFPENIPAIYQSTTEPNQIETQRQDLDGDHLWYRKYQEKVENGAPTNYDELRARNIENKYNRNPKAVKFQDKLHSLGIISDDIYSPVNFTLDENDNPIYLDSFSPWYVHKGIDGTGLRLKFDPAAIEEEILSLTGPDPQTAQSAYKRLMSLYEEERSQISNREKE